jgi:DNA (cytosine-5)-methyltransferase 1
MMSMDLKVVELFAGLGSQTKALQRQNINHEVVGISEWDVNAIISYDAIHTDDGIDYTENMSKEEILEELKDFTFSTDGKKPCDTNRLNNKKLRQLYNANKRSRNLGDITKIKELPTCDLVTYSFPCQDISVAGGQKGFSKGENTRSGLLWEVEKLLLKANESNSLPSVLLMENVKNLVGKKFIDDYNEWLTVLENLGYNTYWEVVNAKNCGIPQNRERVFGISILKSIDDGKFEFPQPFDSGLRLKDMLETDVDDKYYIDSEKAEKLLEELELKNKITSVTFNRKDGVKKEIDVAHTLNASDYRGINRNQDQNAVVECVHMTRKKVKTTEIANTLCSGDPSRVWGNNNPITGVVEEIKSENEVVKVGALNNSQSGAVYDSEGVATTLCANGGGMGAKTGLYVTEDPIILEDFYANREVREYSENAPTLRSDRVGLKVVEPNECVQSHKLCGGKWDKMHDMSRRVYSEDGIAPTMHTCQGGNIEPKVYTNYRIRKLTPTETWRLMGFDDADIDKCIAKGVSNSQLYRQAGNSIVVNVLELIFKNLFNPSK